MKSSVLCLLAATTAFACAVVAGAATNDEGFLIADEPHPWSFPRDHGAHPGYQTEWWYVTGNLRASDGKEFGYQFTIFRRELTTSTTERDSAWATRDILLGHAALTDIGAGRFLHDDLARRPVLGMAGASTESLRVHIGPMSISDTSGPIMLSAQFDEFSYDLALAPLKPPALHGDKGLERKGAGTGQASHYYSLTRLETSGTVRIGGATHAVTGQSWLDHEFASSSLGQNQVGWDWFSLQLSDGSDLMLYNMRLRDGGLDPESSGTHIDPEGRVTDLSRDDFTITSSRKWTSPDTGAVYPLDWRISVPRFGAVLSVTPRVDAQELQSTRSTGVTYWEGSVAVEGATTSGPVTGLGYVELTGYADSLGGRI